MDAYHDAFDKLRAAAIKDYGTIVRPETQTRDAYVNDYHYHDDDDNFCEASVLGFCYGEEDEVEVDECAADWSSAATLMEKP